MNTKLTSLAICIALIVFVAHVEVTTAAVTCNPLQLSPCASAISSSGRPSAMCCSRVKEQRPCICKYMKNPKLQKIIKSPGAKRVAKACGTPYPRC